MAAAKSRQAPPAGTHRRGAELGRQGQNGGSMNRGFLMGAALAAGAVLLVPGVAVALGRAGRPVVRAAMKTGAVAFTEFRRAGAEVYEHMEDIAAELRAEMAEAERAAEAADAGAAEAEAAGATPEARG